MLRALYTSATGMKAQEMLIDNTANNIANVNTTGFKKSSVEFADLMYNTVRAPGTEIATGQMSPTGLQIGGGVRTVGTTKSFAPGTVQETGGATDVAIKGDGFFKVSLPNGEARYTRDGSLKIDGAGRLVTSEGYLLDGGVVIPADTDINELTIGIDGTISGIQTGGSDVVTLGRLQIAKFLNPAGLSSEGSNLYAATPAAGQEQLAAPGSTGFGTLLQRSLEKSNVEVVSELINLITAQRAYEVNSRAVRAGDEMLSTTNEIVR
jgi:flagellar basal-body rod protein FlgG